MNNYIQNTIYEISTGYIKSHLLKIVLNLNIPNKLKNGPKTIKQLCTEIGGSFNEHGLYIVLRTLSTLNIFKEDEEIDKLFYNTEISESLIDSNQYPWLNDSLFHCSLMKYYEPLEESLKIGKPMGVINLGCKDTWEFLDKNDSIKKYFHNTMTEYTKNQIEGILELLDFSKFKCVVDVGGCQGELIKKILNKYDNNNSIIQKAINYDLKQVIEKNEKDYKDKRYNEIIGNFFIDEVIPIGNCFLLKYILHMFTDDQVLQILEKINKSLKLSNQNEVSIYIFEHIIYKNKTSIPISIEYHSANFTEGKERTLNEWKQLINKSPFKIVEIDGIPNSLCSYIKLSY